MLYTHFYIYRYCLTGDYHAERSLRVLREEFKRLRDHVILLNPWDMTVANENLHVHPNEAVQVTLCRMILAHMCV